MRQVYASQNIILVLNKPLHGTNVYWRIMPKVERLSEK